MTPESHSVYQRCWHRFVVFMSEVLCQPHLPATEKSVAAYVAHLHHVEGLKVTTIRSNLSAITFHHKVNSFPSPVSNSFLLEKLLASYGKNIPEADSRLPITLNDLKSILEKVPAHASTERESAMLSALFSLMYHGLLRVSEVAKTEGPTDHNLDLNQLTVTQDKQPHLVLKFKTYKHSLATPAPARMSSITSPECPVKLYAKYLIIRGTFKHNTKAFCHKDAKPLSRDYVQKALSAILSLTHLNPARYNTHSFRIGRATDMAQDGASDQQIMLAGRWKTTAFKKYIRPSVVFL